VWAAIQKPGDVTHSLWSLRADARSGEARGDVSGDMVYPLRLHEGLRAPGVTQCATSRGALGYWIRHEPIPSAAGDGALFAQFAKDHDCPHNRTTWVPLNLARYLLERRDRLDSTWRVDTRRRLRFVRRTFTQGGWGVQFCHARDADHERWGGINSTYSTVLALFAKATGSPRSAAQARAALTYMRSVIDDQCRPGDQLKRASPGGGQEYARTDVLLNYMGAMVAFPAWATAHSLVDRRLRGGTRWERMPWSLPS